MNSVGRKVNGKRPAAIAVGPKHLETPLGIFFFQVQPHGRRVPPTRLNDARTWLDIQGRLMPMNSVLGKGVASRPHNAAHVPHLVKPVLRVVPNSVAENHGRRVPTCLLPALVRFQDGISRMVGSSQRCPLDEKIIHEELPSYVNVNDFGGERPDREPPGAQPTRTEHAGAKRMVA